MKLRVTGLLLVILVCLLVLVPAFAAAAEEPEAPAVEVSEPAEPVTEELPESPAPAVEEIPEPPVSTSPFYLEGVQLTGLVYETMHGVNYVTVESFLSALDPEAVVEEADGMVTVSAVTVTVVELSTEDTGLAEANTVEEILTLSAEVGNCYAQANGRCLYVEHFVQTVEGKVALPIRVLAEIFNLDVGYDSVTRHVTLTRQAGSDAYLEHGDTYYDPDLMYWLSRIIHSESGTQSMIGKLAVGNVVMNRLNDPAFPDTIKGVLFQKNQFSPAMSGSIYRTPGSNSVLAAKMVLDGAVVLEDALFFNRVGMNTFASRNREYVATIGAHSFYA